MSPYGYAYISAIICLGVGAIAYSVTSLLLRPPSGEWLFLAGLTFLTGSFSVKIPSVEARITVSEAFVFIAVLLFGPSVATVIVALDCFVMSFWLKNARLSKLRYLFNLSAVALSIWIAAHAFFWFAGVSPGHVERLIPLESHLVPLFALATLYFLLNSLLVAIALSFDRNISALTIWTQNFPWLSLNYFGGVSVAALLVSYTRSVDLRAVGIILPLLVISYLTYKTSLGRLADAKQHVDQVNQLYMSAIETLAMAVDAKDQITHGHIRRVQAYAIELARRLGVKDERQLRAIEAAALLHDMGKLAIPEHILNKPGKLTDTEFDKMKRHAAIGADLLSSIKFPYPVVPIVRHHHENWNGTGYPSGVSGTDIPIGARILSVVDCFDALTSDRPYRPRLSKDNAFDVLRERRGSMYDPLVVDTFIQSFAEISAAVSIGNEAPSASVEGRDLRITAEDSAWREIRANASESAVLNECASALARSLSMREALEIAAQSLRQLTPATVYALYRYDTGSDSFVCDYAVGDPQGLLRALTIKVSERVSGWSGATLRTSVNSDASLDLGRIANLFAPTLRSTISTPVLLADRVVAVLTAYSPRESAFTDVHQYSFEYVASLFGNRLGQRSSSGSILPFYAHRNT
jgi:putative nucleotidyltransferase with HDIG domain